MNHSPLLPRITQAFHEQLILKHGPCSLDDGILLTLQEAATLVAQGHTRTHHSTNTGLRAFASEAYGCSRAIGLRMLNLKPMVLTPELATTFLAGDLLHDALQAGLHTLLPHLSTEHAWYKDSISGRADGLYDDTVLEIKSCSKSAFAFAQWKGPKPDHIFQAALSALHLGASQLHIIYIAKTPYKRAAKLWADPATPEYISTMDWLLPLDRDQTQDEWNRLSSIAQSIVAGTLPDTETPLEWIADPASQTWPCSYCTARPLCLQLGPDSQPLSRIHQLLPTHPFPTLELQSA